MTKEQIIKMLEQKIREVKSCTDNPEILKIQASALLDLASLLVSVSK